MKNDEGKESFSETQNVAIAREHLVKTGSPTNESYLTVTKTGW
jgi:hypothetical protein